MFYFLVSTESLKKYCHILISQKFGGGPNRLVGGALAPQAPMVARYLESIDRTGVVLLVELQEPLLYLHVASL